MKKFKFRLTYFKESGKYYCDGVLEIECEALDGRPDIPYMHDVIDKVKIMRKNGGLPGLQSGKWEDAILISELDSSFPHLVVPEEYKEYYGWKAEREAARSVRRTFGEE